MLQPRERLDCMLAQASNEHPLAGVLYGPPAAAASDRANAHTALGGSGQTSGAPLQAEQLAAAKLSRRRRQLEAAVEEQEPPRPSLQQKQQRQQQPAGQQRQAQQHSNLQAPSGQEEKQAGGVVPVTAEAPQAQQGRPQAGQHPQGQLPPELQREVAAAAAAIAAVGGSSSRQPQTMQQGLQQPRGGVASWGAGSSMSVPLRPLIRRRAVGGRSSLQQMAGGSSSGSNMRGGRAGSGRHQAARRPGGSHPTAVGWRDAGQQEEGVGGGEEEDEDEDEDESYRARLPTSMQPWLDAQEAEQAAEGAKPERGPAGPRFGRQPGGGAGDDGEEEDERRSSPIVEISLLLAECVQHGLRTIAFCKSRWVASAPHIRWLLRERPRVRSLLRASCLLHAGQQPVHSCLGQGLCCTPRLAKGLTLPCTSACWTDAASCASW